jgi:hypothetical protein
LDVDHTEDGPWTAAKSTDNITLKHEASVRRPVADLILACADPLPVALMLLLVMAQNASAMNQRASGAVSCYSALSFSNSACTCQHFQHLLQAQPIMQHFPFSSPHARLARVAFTSRITSTIL